MILQQTLTNREKTFATFAVLFLVGLVAFGYVQTVASPLQASVLHANAIEKNNETHYEQLTSEFNKVRESIGVIKSVEIKAKIRSIKACLVDAVAKQSAILKDEKTPITSVADAYSSCEVLFVDVENALQENGNAVSSLESQVTELETKVNDYGKVVDQALGALQKKDATTVKAVER